MLHSAIDSMAESLQAVQYFPLAAQPDVVRSAQKDRLCLHILEASVTDVVQGLLGPAAVFRYRDALQALSAALYFGGSTGAAQPSCPANYCLQQALPCAITRVLVRAG